MYSWLMGATLLLMITAGLFAVIASFLLGVKPGGLQIIYGYAIYLTLSAILLVCFKKKQFYVSAIDLFALAFLLLIIAGLLFGMHGAGLAEAKINLFYFILFVCTPFVLGRVFSIEAIARFEIILISVLLLILVLIFIKGGIQWPEGAVRPILFSSSYSTLSLSFVFGMGVFVSIWRGCVVKKKSVALFYGGLLMLFMASSAHIALRGSYYLTVVCALGLLLVARKQKFFFLMSIALALSVLLGVGISSGAIVYHERLFHPALGQLSFRAVYLDFFSLNAFNIEPGRPVLSHVNCVPIAESNDSAMIRLMLYLEAVKLFLSAPLFGVGVSRFSQFSCLSGNGFPHSTILHVAAEMGLFGLGLFITMIFKSLAIIRRATLSAKLPYWMFFVFVYYFGLDQLYGSYFTSPITYFMVGLASKMLADQCTIKVGK